MSKTTLTRLVLRFVLAVAVVIGSVAPVAAALDVPIFNAVPGVAAAFVNGVVPLRSSAVAPVTGRLCTDDFCE